MQQPIVQRLRNLLHEKLGVDVPDPETDLFGEGLVDSLVFVDLVMLLEEEFGLRVDLAEVDFEQFRTLNRIAALLPQPPAASEATVRSAAQTR